MVIEVMREWYERSAHKGVVERKEPGGGGEMKRWQQAGRLEM